MSPNFCAVSPAGQSDIEPSEFTLSADCLEVLQVSGFQANPQVEGELALAFSSDSAPIEDISLRADLLAGDISSSPESAESVASWPLTCEEPWLPTAVVDSSSCHSVPPAGHLILQPRVEEPWLSTADNIWQPGASASPVQAVASHYNCQAPPAAVLYTLQPVSEGPWLAPALAESSSCQATPAAVPFTLQAALCPP